MPTIRSTARGAAILALAAGFVAVGQPSRPAAAADHLDAPSASADRRIDITDVYAFRSSATKTTLVMNVNPLTSPADTKGATLRPSTLYQFRVDTNLDGHADTVYRLKFGAVTTHTDGTKSQPYTLRRATGMDARMDKWNGTIIAHGDTTRAGRSPRITAISGGGRVFVGPREDPFFLDLPGLTTFKQRLLAGETVLSNPGKTGLLDGFTSVDTFAGTNVTSIVVELPNGRIGGTGSTVGVWASTSVSRAGMYQQLDRMGRPAINTLFNNTKAEKEAGNRLSPKDDRATFHDNVVAVFDAVGNVLVANNATPYMPAQIEALANTLLPDTLTVKLGDPAGFLNGRRLADDVVDAAFNLLTNGAITTGDGVNANDHAFGSSFPFLAAPHN